MMEMVMAAVLCVPAGVMFIGSAVVLAMVLPFGLWFLLSSTSSRKNPQESDHLIALQHVVITGGSRGIGLAIARECVQRGAAHVTLLARGIDGLEAAQTELLTLHTNNNDNNTSGSSSHIQIVPVDVTDASAVKQVAQQVCDGTNKAGPPTILFNVAGSSVPQRFLDLDVKMFQTQMDVNYLGAAHVTHAFLPKMASGSTVVFTSSQGGQVGIYGLSAYAPSKFALRGLVEVLHMECAPDNICIQIAYPPDTDTPGYAEEMRLKPPECHMISETSGLWNPKEYVKQTYKQQNTHVCSQVYIYYYFCSPSLTRCPCFVLGILLSMLYSVAKKMVTEAIRRRKFHVYFGLEGWMLSTLTAGMSPAGSHLWDVLAQVCLMGLLRLVSLFYLKDFDQKIQSYRRSNNETITKPPTNPPHNTKVPYGSMQTSDIEGSI
jgi:3-dehydrosphinganine reductase